MAKNKTRALKAQFDVAHAKGMKALKRHDYNALGEAITEEATIINKQNTMITAHREASEALSQEIVSATKTSKKSKKKR